MQFKTEIQKSTYDTVVRFAKELFGEFNLGFPDDSPMVILAFPGTTSILFIRIFPWMEDLSFIEVRGLVAQGTELASDLMLYLLKKNEDSRYGGFAIDDKGDIWFIRSIVGPDCGKKELEFTLMAVAIAVDKYGDEIVARWGGRRAFDG